MSDKKLSEGGFLDNWRGLLLRAFQFTPYGTALGINPLTNNPISNRITQGINEAVRDTVRDAVAGMTWLATDKETANKYADEVEQFWRNNINRYDPRLGQAEFRMAVGWKMPAGIPYNGVIDPKRDNQEITRMDAVFYRNEKGQVEILDARDTRYTNLVAPYIAAQIMIPTYAAKAVGAAIAAVATTGKVAGIAAQGINVAGKVAGPAHTIGGVGFGVSTGYSNLVLKPEAIDRLAHLYDDPKKMTPELLRAELNKAFEQYSLLNGPLSEQYYVPPIKPNESPLSRLQELSKGFMKDIFVSAHPFDRITNLGADSPHRPKESIRLNDVRKEISENLDFQRGFLKLALRTLSGDKLSDQEITLLKFGTGIYVTDRKIDLSVPAKGYSDKDRDQIRRDLLVSLSSNLFPSDDKADTSKVLSEINERLKFAESQIKERDRPKNPIIQNRIDSPFVLG
jgi:hypothetical protein